MAEADPIAAAISALSAETDTETETEEPTEAAPDAAASGEQPADAEPDDEEEKPATEWTPEKLKEERIRLETAEAKLLEHERKIARQYKDLGDKSKNLRRRNEKFQMELEQHTARAKELEADVYALRHGDTRTILSKLAKLAGKDPVGLYREMGEALATDGRAKPAEKPAVDPELAAKLERLEMAEAARQAEAANAAILRGVHATLVPEVQDASKYPSLAAYASANPAEAAKELLSEMLRIKRDERRDISVDEICVLAEHRLQSRKEPTEAPSGSETVAAARDATRKSPPGSSISPSTASATAGKRRPMTEEERWNEALKLVPQVVSDLKR